MYIIAGPPGAGKTTQSKMLAEKLGFIWISAGELLRRFAEGEERETMLKGELVDDEYVDMLVARELDKYQDKHNRVILDGFPRDFHEARWLLEDYGASVKALILIELNESTVRARLKARGRTDDTDEAIDERIEVYKEETNSILEYIENTDVEVVRIDGSQKVDEVFRDIEEIVG